MIYDLKLKWRVRTYQEGKREISENETHGTSKAIPMGETYNKYGDAARKVESGPIGKHVFFANSFPGDTGR